MKAYPNVKGKSLGDLVEKQVGLLPFSLLQEVVPFLSVPSRLCERYPMPLTVVALATRKSERNEGAMPSIH